MTNLNFENLFLFLLLTVTKPRTSKNLPMIPLLNSEIEGLHVVPRGCQDFHHSQEQLGTRTLGE